MGFRFRKSFKVMPGVRLNVSKSGFSTSLGGRGATVNLSGRGVRGTAGIPGTGISFSQQIAGGRRKRGGLVDATSADPTYLAASYEPATSQGASVASIVIGVTAPLILASIAADSVGGWFGWMTALCVFGFVMLSLGRQSAGEISVEP